MDATRFDSLTRSLAAATTRRGFLGSLAAATTRRGFLGSLATLGAGLLGTRTTDAQVTQAQCGNTSCRTNPGKCAPGCVCCVWGNGNTRCTPPGSCTGTPTCPAGLVPDPARGGCVAPCTGAGTPGNCPPPAATACQVVTCAPNGICSYTPALPNTACGAGRICCGGVCVANTTATTCGACGVTCPGGTCATGTCVLPTTTTTTTTTSTTTTAAPTTTTTTTSAPTNLPDGSACGASAQCSSGACCANVCRSLFTDRNNCGACGTVCPAIGGSLCLSGECCQGQFRGVPGLGTCSANLPCCIGICQAGGCCQTEGRSCGASDIGQCCDGLVCAAGVCRAA